MIKNILYIGHFKDASGYANAARGYLKVLHEYLDKSIYNLKIISMNFEKEDYSSDEEKKILSLYELNNIDDFIKNNKYTLLVHALPNFCNIDAKELPIKQCLENKNCIKKINLVAWETDIVPKFWVDIYKNKVYDELIVFCDWNKKIFEDQTGLKATVVYHPVLDYDKKEKIRNEKFKIFSMSQWQHRKGFDILLKAYYQEFFDQKDVELFIKTYRSETTKGFDPEKEKNIVVNEINLYKNQSLHYGQLPKCRVILKTGFCDKNEIIDLYNKSDVFCSPTRGEAFGLTIAQAALSGLPCIVPNIGGHLDYLDPDHNYFINSSLEPAYNMPFPVYSSKDMNLVEPSLLSTRKKLRQAYNDWKERKINFLNVKNYSKKVLDNANIFKKLLEVL